MTSPPEPQHHVAAPDQGSASDPSPRWLSIDSIEPCPIQPRVTISVDLVAELARSIAEGRHQPLVEVEPLADRPDRYQLVCGEQRWRAARQAGRTRILALVSEPLSHRERLRKQVEENQLRAALDPVETANAVLLAKVLADVEVAERLLGEAGVSFQPLAASTVSDRADFHRHLGGLKCLLVENGTHVVRASDELVCGPLSPWRETERALGISEAGRKQKLSILRLPPELQDEVRQLPAEHAIQIARLPDRERQDELLRRASELSHRQVRDAVDRLRSDPELEVEQVLEAEPRSDSAGPLGFEIQLAALADLCRQLARRLGYLSPRLSPAEREQVRDLLADLGQAMARLE